MKNAGIAAFCCLVFALVLTERRSAAFILCQREADFAVTNPSPESPDDACTGTVMLQGLRYQCGPRSAVDTSRARFLEELRTQGESLCKEYCSKKGWPWNKCYGHFSPPQQCGFTVPMELAESYGREIASCDPACGGIAFAYCSIYHASTLQAAFPLPEGSIPNCSCRRNQ